MTTEVKFSAGPWICDDSEAPDPIKVTVAARMQLTNRKAPIAHVDTDYSEPFASEQRANLALILAAPDLYEAVERLLRTHDDPADPDSAVAMEREIASVAFARKALSKAQPTNPTAQGDEQ